MAGFDAWLWTQEMSFSLLAQQTDQSKFGI